MPRQSRPHHVSVTRYRLDGREVPKGTPGARKHRERTSTYYATVNRKRYPLETDDLGEAWSRLRELQRRLEDEAAGIRDAHRDQARRPLEEHLAEWREALTHKGTSAEHVELMGARLRTLATLAGWRRVTDLTAGSLLAAMNRLATEPGLSAHGRGPKKGGKTPLAVPISAQTRNHYLSHAKQFARWCCDVAPKRLRDNPFTGLRPVSVESDRRHDRRCPTDAEVAALFASMETAPKRKGMTGPQRAMAYKVAMATGFRASEVRSLSRESFDLAMGTVAVRAAYSKRRRKDTQPIPPWLVSELREWFAMDGGCWEGLPETYPGRLLQDDLEHAGVPYAMDGPDGPTYLDWHSFRVWYCTQIANQPGMSPKTMMELCRHSTPALSLRTYAKARQHDLKAAADAIPPVAPAVAAKKDNA